MTTRPTTYDRRLTTDDLRSTTNDLKNYSLLTLSSEMTKE